MIPVLFRIGPITVYSYGLMMALGFLAADFVIARQCKERGLTTDFASSIIVWAAIAGIAGSRIYDILDNFPVYMADPKSMFLSGAGFVWYGGLGGGILAVYFVARRYGVRFSIVADMCAPALAIGQAIGRIGCQLSGDGDWGVPSKLPWAMAYHNAIVGWNSSTVLALNRHHELVSGFFPGVRVHPAPIYETILYTGVFAILWSLRKRPSAQGRMFYMYLVLIGAARFTVEFVRINPRVLYGLSEAQVISAVMVAVGAAALYLSRADRFAVKGGVASRV